MQHYALSPFMRMVRKLHPISVASYPVSSSGSSVEAPVPEEWDYWAFTPVKLQLLNSDSDAVQDSVYQDGEVRIQNVLPPRQLTNMLPSKR